MIKTKSAMRVCSLMLLAFMMLLTTHASAALYKWVDENGAVHFSDQQPIQDDATELDTASMGGGVSTVKGDPAMQNRVESFSTSWCTYCKKARVFLKKNKIRFSEYDIERNRAAALRKKRLDPQPGVPFAVINGVLKSMAIKKMRMPRP